MSVMPDATKFVVARIRDEAYYCTLPRYKKGTEKYTTFTNIKPDIKINFRFGTLAHMPSDEYLWIFAYDHKKYDDVINEIESGTPITFNAVPFGKGEWI